MDRVKKFISNNKWVLCLFCGFIVFGIIGCFFYLNGCIKSMYTVEAGVQFDIHEVCNVPFGNVEVVGGDDVDITKLGQYSIEVSYLNKTYNVDVFVVDTIAPMASGKEISTSYLVALDAIDCVENIEDVTAVCATFKNEIDYDLEAVQEIIILLEDEGGNVSEVLCYVTVVQDVTPPIISGDDTYRSLVGSSITYRNLVTVEDDSQEDVSLDIDNQNVDINTVGTYVVIFTATDFAGNVSVKEVTIEIYENTTASNATTTSSLESKAQSILDSITTSSMSKTQIATAIHTWCYNNISYTGVNSATSWQDAAYTGLTYRAGNCYTFYATAKSLLTQAGISNIDITAPQHYWNLVDVGTGWLHFDTTIAADGIRICLWTSEQLANYHASSYLPRHDYDASLYPTIN